MAQKTTAYSRMLLCPPRKVLRPLQAESDFSSLAERLREGEGQRADWDRATRDALAHSAHTEAQLRSSEV